MTTLAASNEQIKKPWVWIVAGGFVLMVWGAIAFLNLNRPRLAANAVRTKEIAQFYDEPVTRDNGFAARQESKALVAASPAASIVEAAAGRKIIRTGSLAMIVQHPAETAEKITALAESFEGYLVSADGGGEDATAGSLTIRVPANRFQEARAQIRQLGLHIESERIDAQDVSRQYVDQDASLRNLRAEESQYLSILKQANSVKDMLAVSERLAEVRGQIEQQQAEFNALSGQIETVAISISLRTEVKAKTFGLNWHPGEALKAALRDGLESLANYATAMMTFMFYLPATLLWVGTIALGVIVSWKAVRWTGRKFFGWAGMPAQG